MFTETQQQIPVLRYEIRGATPLVARCGDSVNLWPLYEHGQHSWQGFGPYDHIGPDEGDYLAARYFDSPIARVRRTS
jgi:hypothetical protein